MSRRTKLVIAVALVLLAAACGGWAWFLSGKTLNDADKWSSVMIGFTSVILGAGGLLIGLLALHQPARTASQAPPARSGSGNVRVGRDNSGVIITGDHNQVGPGPTP